MDMSCSWLINQSIFSLDDHLHHFYATQACLALDTYKWPLLEEEIGSWR